MLMLGASPPESRDLAELVRDAAVSGHPVFLWSDGHEVVALVGDASTAPGDLQRLARQCLDGEG